MHLDFGYFSNLQKKDEIEWLYIYLGNQNLHLKIHNETDQYRFYLLFLDLDQLREVENTIFNKIRNSID